MKQEPQKDRSMKNRVETQEADEYELLEAQRILFQPYLTTRFDQLEAEIGEPLHLLPCGCYLRPDHWKASKCDIAYSYSDAVRVARRNYETEYLLGDPSNTSRLKELREIVHQATQELVSHYLPTTQTT